MLRAAVAKYGVEFFAKRSYQCSSQVAERFGLGS